MGAQYDQRSVIESELIESQAADTAEPLQRWTTARMLWSPWTLLVGVVGVVIRLWIISTARGNLLADEAYTGLQAAEVLRGQFRIVIPSLTYTAPFDSYLLAPFTAVLGQNIYVLKLYPSVAWALTAVMVVAIVRRLATDRAAVIAGSMIWLAPGSLAVIATRGYQSYASGMALVVGAVFAVLLLDEQENRGAAPHAMAWRSALVGAVAGFAFYLHPMYGAVLVPLIVVPCWSFRTRVREWWLPAIAGAVVVNVPFLAWNAANGWPSLAQPAAATDGPIDRFARYFTELVPRAYGLRGQAGDDIFGPVLSVVVLFGVFAMVAFGAVVLWRRSRASSLPILVPLAAGWVLMAGLTNTAFVIDGRYAIITFAFVVMALASGVDRLLPRVRGMATLAIVVWVAVFSLPLLVNDTGTHSAEPNAGFAGAVDLLEANGVDRVLGYYWWVLPVEFLSDQHIRSATAGNPAVVLLPDTQRLVEASPPEDVAFIFWNQEEDVSRLLMPIGRYERTELDDVVVYIPTR